MSFPDPNASGSTPPPGAPSTATGSVPGRVPEPSGPGGTRYRALIGLGAVVVVLAAVLAWSLRGGDSPTGTPLSPVAQAAEKTAAAGGVRLAGTGRVTGGGIEMTMRFRGAVGAGGERAQMTYDVTSPSLAGAAAQVGPMEQVVDGSALYMSSPMFASVLGGKRWVKVDLGDLAPKAQAGSPTDAAGLLARLRASGPDPQLVGRQRVRGTRTRHYRATIDPALQAEQLREAGYDEAAELVEQQSAPTTVDVWIGRDDLVHRMAMTVGFDLLAAAGGGSQMQMTMDFFDFGADPVIAVPPDDDVTDIRELEDLGFELEG